MKHDPADLSHRKPDPAAQDDRDQRVHALPAVLPRWSGLPSPDKAMAEADDRAQAGVAAGHFYDPTVIRAWLDPSPDPVRSQHERYGTGCSGWATA